MSLSKGGRLTLTQSVLDSLPCCLFSLLQAPVSVINRMEKKVRDFVSTGRSTKWDTTSRPICNGSLGIGSFRQKTILLSPNGCGDFVR